jgi:hypothetical protein
MSSVSLLSFVFVCFCFDSLDVLNHRYHPLLFLFLLFTFLQTFTPENFWVYIPNQTQILYPNPISIPKTQKILYSNPISIPNINTQNPKNFIPKPNIHTQNPKNFIPKLNTQPNIHTQNPKPQNLVNLFLIYIHNHFFFYSNQIIPFFFNLFLFSISLIYYSFYIFVTFRHMHPIKPKGLSLGLGFQFVEYLG